MSSIELYNIWSNKRRGISERCLIKDNGDYIGQNTGEIYLKENHYHSSKIKGKIVKIDKVNNTGMLHLDEAMVNRKGKYIGCVATFERAHYFGNIQVYRCLELKEYFTQNEIEILE